MTATDQIVSEYLDRLYECARSLTRSQVEELIADVREHVAAAIAEAGRDDEATVRTVLDRLGTPEDIVAAAAEQEPAAAPVGETTVAGGAKSRSWTWREVVAVVLLVPGAFFAPILGPLAGIAFAWGSDVWDKGTKRVAYAIGGIGALAPLLFLAALLPMRTNSTLTIRPDASVSSAPVKNPGAGVPVPDVVGASESQGTQELLNAGFVVATAYVQSESAAPGVIASMSPDAGTVAPFGSQVSIVVVGQ